LRETLTTSVEFNDGPSQPVNISDGLFAIASALHRIAACNEKAHEMAQARIEALEEMMDLQMGGPRQ
jgi:hypothetical protein